VVSAFWFGRKPRKSKDNALAGERRKTRGRSTASKSNHQGKKLGRTPAKLKKEESSTLELHREENAHSYSRGHGPQPKKLTKRNESKLNTKE